MTAVDERWVTPQATPPVEVVITEELDLAAVPRLRALFEDALRMRPERLVVDLDSCAFVDATALGLLLEVHRQVRRQGGSLVLRHVRPRVARLIALTRLHGVFTLEPA